MLARSPRTEERNFKRHQQEELTCIAKRQTATRSLSFDWLLILNVLVKAQKECRQVRPQTCFSRTNQRVEG